MAEYLSGVFATLWEFLTTLWANVVAFFTELPLKVLSGVLGAVASLIEAIPVPDFLSGGLQSFLSAVDPSVLYFLAQSGFPEAVALLGSGFAFRMVRKAATLGQW